MPDIEMYPPSGIAFSPYSVSPFILEKIVGPKPIMYWPTRTPKRFAGIRWPSSWRPIDNASPTTMMRMPRMYSRTVSTAQE